MWSDKRHNPELERLVVPAVVQWIKCDEAMPPERRAVLIYAHDGIHIARLMRDTLSQKNVWEMQGDFKPHWEVSHWMPLPSRPEGK